MAPSVPPDAESVRVTGRRRAVTLARVRELAMRRLEDGHFRLPSSQDPTAKRALVDSRYPRPIGDDPAFAADLEKVNARGISPLLYLRCPPHVSGLVVPVVVDAVERVLAGRSAPDVGKEALERLAPAIAHRDTATAVSVKRLMLRVEAARDDA